MGRPKVSPENRLRANTACTKCRASKKRCSGSFPCTNCVRKGHARSCIPFKSISQTSPSNHRDPTPRSQPRLDTVPAWNDSNEPLNTPLSPPIRAGSPTDRLLQRQQRPAAGSRSPEATHRTHPRMLRNLQGDRGMRSYLHSLKELEVKHRTHSLCWQSCVTVVSATPSRDSVSAYWAIAILP
jgi:hypothetical protein